MQKLRKIVVKVSSSYYLFKVALEDVKTRKIILILLSFPSDILKKYLIIFQRGISLAKIQPWHK